MRSHVLRELIRFTVVPLSHLPGNARFNLLETELINGSERIRGVVANCGVRVRLHNWCVRCFEPLEYPNGVGTGRPNSSTLPFRGRTLSQERPSMFRIIALWLVTIAPFGDLTERSRQVDASTSLDEYQEAKQLFKRSLHDVVEMSKNDDEAKTLLKVATERERIARFMKLVADHPKDPDSVDALIWVCKFSPWPPSLPQTFEGDEARRVLARDFIGEARIELALSGRFTTASGSDAAERLYRKALAESPHREVQARACFWLARYLKDQAEWVWGLHRPDDGPNAGPAARRGAPGGEAMGAEALKRLRAKDPDKLRKEAESLFEKAVSRYGDVAAYGYCEDLGKIGEAATKELAAIGSLAVGAVAPDLEGEDSDGRRFKLSDYRGKVVLLTFSGEWCGPCRAVYPHEREIVQQFKDQAFTLLSVCTDKERDTVKKAIADRRITWRCWWDGGTEGPLCTAWHITSFPTVFVIDKGGVVRHKDIQGKELDDAIRSLIQRQPK